MKTPDYMSYTSYKKKKESSSKKGLLVFVITFFVTLLGFTVIVKHLTPDVDVVIGDDNDVEAKESGLGVKKFIDNRLKMIQMEDNSAGGLKNVSERKRGDYRESDSDEFSKEYDEKVVLPQQDEEDVSLEEEKKVLSSRNAPRPTNSKDLSTPIETPTVSKVFVGYYSTVDQAKVAQGILLDSGLNITPFIKDLGGAYTLQVGSYSNRAKAQSLASELLRNSFPARVVQE